MGFLGLFNPSFYEHLRLGRLRELHCATGCLECLWVDRNSCVIAYNVRVVVKRTARVHVPTARHKIDIRRVENMRLTFYVHVAVDVKNRARPTGLERLLNKQWFCVDGHLLATGFSEIRIFYRELVTVFRATRVLPILNHRFIGNRLLLLEPRFNLCDNRT